MSWYVFRRCDVRDPSLNTHSLQGPITEEVVFRACMLAVYHMAGSSRTKMIFLSPLAFGVGTSTICPCTSVANCRHSVAHFHHAWDTYNRYGRTASAARVALLTTCRSHSALLPCAAVHAGAHCSVPDGIYQSIRVPLRVSLPPHRLTPPAHRIAYLLQHHGPPAVFATCKDVPETAPQ